MLCCAAGAVVVVGTVWGGATVVVVVVGAAGGGGKLDPVRRVVEVVVVMVEVVVDDFTVVLVVDVVFGAALDDVTGLVVGAVELVVDRGARQPGDVVGGDAVRDPADGREGEGQRDGDAERPQPPHDQSASHPSILVQPGRSRAQADCKCASSSRSGHGPRHAPSYPESVAKLLIVEDDARLRVPLVHSLTARGHTVAEASSGLPALQSIVDDPPDVVLLDLGLPDIDGGDLLKMLRAVSNVPLIVGTARDEEREIVRLLDAGADDYIVKPFSAEQVDARIRALLRRAAGSEPTRIVVGELIVDADARTAELSGRSLELSRKEFDLLLYLARRCGTVVTKQELLADVWEQPFGGVEKTIDTHLSWLRGKLGETASAPRYLHTVRGVGIKLLAPDD